MWSHEFAGDYRSWEPQVRFFSRRYQVITYCARGTRHLRCPRTRRPTPRTLPWRTCTVAADLGIEQAYLGGLSMGGALVLNFGIAHPQMAKALVVASAGSGSTDPETFQRNCQETGDRLLAQGMDALTQGYAQGPTRVAATAQGPQRL